MSLTERRELHTCMCEGAAESAARQCLLDAIGNVDILLEMLTGLSVFPDKD
jgi:hypothetical protein